MVVEGNGTTYKYLTSDIFLNKTRRITHKVNFFRKIFTKQNTCYCCKSKIINKKNRVYLVDGYNKESCFDFDFYCDTCGAQFFKHNNTIYYNIDEKLINERKAKLNKLLNK